MKKPDAIHPDFAKMPRFTFSFHPVMAGVMQGLIRLERALRAARPSDDVSWQRRTLPCRDGGSFDVLVITPHEKSVPAPLLIFFHGGAFALPYASNHVRFCERYAAAAGCVAMVVDYRLAPRHPFPHGFDDCFGSLEWALSHAGELYIDIQRIALMGDSAGGALAAGVAQKARDHGIALRAQLLIYPVLDSECKTPSAKDFTDVPIFNAESNRRMWTMYLKDFKGQAPAYAAPALRKDLSGLPEAYVELTEFDPLRDEGRAYAEALEQQGVPVVVNHTRGTIHGFEAVPGSSLTQAALAARIDFLRHCFG